MHYRRSYPYRSRMKMKQKGDWRYMKGEMLNNIWRKVEFRRIGRGIYLKRRNLARKPTPPVGD
ncbi:Uncharacterized protein BM_BM17911 [Brugia malayi]|uniref:Uncharacterized protein n=1 Tax=Brugia malayi TaxID=6279 RepID=A0A4E9ERJ2_BRUMA|nr:Uncharacterized protein BM_BM17911 [Brugia malayi]VIO86191.1 Uncharacterized protein BM_BM17911 [Brugia malayi]